MSAPWWRQVEWTAVFQIVFYVLGSITALIIVARYVL